MTVLWNRNLPQGFKEFCARVGGWLSKSTGWAEHEK
jgi:hypothetical protein